VKVIGYERQSMHMNRAAMAEIPTNKMIKKKDSYRSETRRSGRIMLRNHRGKYPRPPPNCNHEEGSYQNRKTCIDTRLYHHLHLHHPLPIPPQECDPQVSAQGRVYSYCGRWGVAEGTVLAPLFHDGHDHVFDVGASPPHTNDAGNLLRQEEERMGWSWLCLYQALTESL